MKTHRALLPRHRRRLGSSAPAEAAHPDRRGSSPRGLRVPATTDLDPAGGAWHFAIEDQDGDPVHDFTPVHERDLHLIVVNRELTVFHHVHPTLDADGTWTIDLPVLDPGSYRAVTDFQITDGPRLALGTDLSVTGTYRPSQLAGTEPGRDRRRLRGHARHRTRQRR